MTTNKSIQKWLEAQAAVIAAAEYADKCLAQAERAAVPKKLRPATAADLTKVGQVVWYPHWDECKWAMVEEPRDYGDAWKAYTAHDGCRYGLKGAYIELVADSACKEET